MYQTSLKSKENYENGSCVGVLSDIIPKLTWYQLFSLIRPAPSGPVGFLFIDSVGVMANVSLGDVSVTTVGMLIDSDTPVPRKYLDKFIKNRAEAENNPRALFEDEGAHCTA
ncbi:unnamed protein product [Symbiodinium sp. CCMP2592]|nr:unnamed protein product [Symbiodinium sp. CCMP2592]